MHEFNIRDVADGFNTSHVINRLSFGDRLGGMVDSPLEGRTSGSECSQPGRCCF